MHILYPLSVYKLNNNLDIIAIGPTIVEVHSIKEKGPAIRRALFLICDIF